MAEKKKIAYKNKGKKYPNANIYQHNPNSLYGDIAFTPPASDINLNLDKLNQFSKNNPDFYKYAFNAPQDGGKFIMGAIGHPKSGLEIQGGGFVPYDAIQSKYFKGDYFGGIKKNLNPNFSIGVTGNVGIGGYPNREGKFIMNKPKVNPGVNLKWTFQDGGALLNDNIYQHNPNALKPKQKPVAPRAMDMTPEEFHQQFPKKEVYKPQTTYGHISQEERNRLRTEAEVNAKQKWNSENITPKSETFTKANFIEQKKQEFQRNPKPFYDAGITDADLYDDEGNYDWESVAMKMETPEFKSKLINNFENWEQGQYDKLPLWKKGVHNVGSFLHDPILTGSRLMQGERPIFGQSVWLNDADKAQQLANQFGIRTNDLYDVSGENESSLNDYFKWVNPANYGAQAALAYDKGDYTNAAMHALPWNRLAKTQDIINLGRTVKGYSSQGLNYLNKKPSTSFNSKDKIGEVVSFGYKPPLSFSEKMKTLFMNKSNKQKFLAEKTVDDAFDYADRFMKDPEYLKRFEDIKSMTPSIAADEQDIVDYIRREVKSGRMDHQYWDREQILKMADDEISSNFLDPYRHNTSGIGVEHINVPQYLNRTSKIPQQTSVQHLKDGIKIKAGPNNRQKLGTYTMHVDENLGKKGTESIKVETKNLGDLASVTVHEALGHGKTFGPITFTQKEKELLKSVFKTNNKASGYIKSPTEVMARIDEIRFTLNKNEPFKIITEKDLSRFEKMLNPAKNLFGPSSRAESSLMQFMSNVDKKQLAKVMNRMYASTGVLGIGAGAMQQKKYGGNISKQGYAIGSPDEFNSSNLIQTTPYVKDGVMYGNINMNNTKIPLFANGIPLKPFSGVHPIPVKEDGIVKEIPMKQTNKKQNGDRLITLKNNKELIDGVANWQTMTDAGVEMNFKFNDQIKNKLYSGKWGFDPSNGQLVKLNKTQAAPQTTDKYSLQAQQAAKSGIQEFKVPSKENYQAMLNRDFTQVDIPDSNAWNPSFSFQGGTQNTADYRGGTVLMTPEEAKAYEKAQLHSSMVATQNNPIWYLPGTIASGGSNALPKHLIKKAPQLLNKGYQGYKNTVQPFFQAASKGLNQPLNLAKIAIPKTRFTSKINLLPQAWQRTIPNVTANNAFELYALSHLPKGIKNFAKDPTWQNTLQLGLYGVGAMGPLAAGYQGLKNTSNYAKSVLPFTKSNPNRFTPSDAWHKAEHIGSSGAVPATVPAVRATEKITATTGVLPPAPAPAPAVPIAGEEYVEDGYTKKKYGGDISDKNKKTMKKKKNQKGKRYPSNIYQYGSNDPRGATLNNPWYQEQNFGLWDGAHNMGYQNDAYSNNQLLADSRTASDSSSSSGNWASNNMGTIGAIAGGVGNIVNMATSGQPTEAEDYVDVVQDTVASVIPVAGIFHTAAGIGENIAASTAGGDTYDNQRAADIAERIWQPHTWLTKGLPGKRKDSNIPGAYIKGTQIDDPYESQANNIAAFAKYGGNIYQNSSADGMPVESIHYRDRIYDLGPALGKQHYSKLKPALQRRLDYLFGESGMRDADTGEIIYTTNTPTLTKGNRTNLFNPIEAEKAGGDMKYSTIKNPFYGLTIGDREIPHGESWRVPSKYLGKDYPTALINTKNYGGNIYQHSPAPLKTTTGGNKAIIPSADYIAAYEKLGLPMPPNAVITAADLEHFENTGFARGYELPPDITETVKTIDPKTVVKNNMKIPYPKVSYPYRKGEHYIDAHGRKLPIASRSNNYQYGGQPGSVPTTEFNAGGSHDENPLGGIPQGMHPNGKPNLVEEGELKITDPRNDEFFVISPKVKLDKATAEEFDLPKRYIGKDMVKIFNSVLRKESKRDGDTIEEHSKELEIAPYIDAHKKLSAEKNAEEEAKEQAAFAEDMGEMVEKYPEYMQALMSQGQQGPSPEEQQMMEQQMIAQQQGGMPQGQPSPEEMAMMQQQGMAPQGPPMMEYGSYMQYLNGGNIHQFSQAGGLTREEQMKANPNLSFHTNVLNNDPNSLSSLGKTAAGFGAADMSSAKNNLKSAQFYNNLNAEMAGYANNKQLGGDMPQQQMPQQQEEGQELVQQVVQALQQGITQGIEQGMSQKEATQQAVQGIMGKLVESGMPEEEAGQLLQQIIQQFQEEGQPNERPDYDRNAPSDPRAQLANGGNIYQFSQDDYLIPQLDPSIGEILNPPESFDHIWPYTEDIPEYVGETNYTPYNISGFMGGRGTPSKKTKEIKIKEKDDPKVFEFEKPLASYLKYAPVAYNLLQGMFGNRDKKTLSDYYQPISAPERNYDEFNRQMARNRAGLVKKIKQGGPTGYKSAMLAADINMQEQIAKVYEMTGNQEAQDKLKTDMFNATKRYEGAVTRDKFNAMTDAQQQAYLDSAFTQLGQIGDTEERNKLGLMMANIMSPDFQITEKDLLDFKKWKEEKNNKA